MAVNLSPIWGAGAQLLDNSGNVLSGGKIYTYAAGTTTPAATYTSSNGLTANSNPIILNSAGRVPYEIWLTDGISYKFVLKDSNDVLIATYDNLTGINSNFIAYTAQQEIQTATAGQTVFTLTTMQYQPATNNLSVFVDGVNQYGPGAQYAYVETSSTVVTFVNGLHVGASVKFTTASPVSSASTNAADVSYDPPFTGSVATNVADKLAQTVSVKDFGAVGDGVTDDTAAIQAAIDSITNTTFATTWPSGVKNYNKGGGVVYIPPGRYRITSGLLLGQHVRIQGASTKGFYYPDDAETTGALILADFDDPNGWVFSSANYNSSGTPIGYRGNTGGAAMDAGTYNFTHGIEVRDLMIKAVSDCYGGIRLIGSPNSKLENVGIYGTDVGYLFNASWGVSARDVFSVTYLYGFVSLFDVNGLDVNGYFNNLAGKTLDSSNRLTGLTAADFGPAVGLPDFSNSKMGFVSYYVYTLNMDNVVVENWEVACIHVQTQGLSNNSLYAEGNTDAIFATVTCSGSLNGMYQYNPTLAGDGYFFGYNSNITLVNTPVMGYSGGSDSGSNVKIECAKPDAYGWKYSDYVTFIGAPTGIIKVDSTSSTTNIAYDSSYTTLDEALRRIINSPIQDWKIIVKVDDVISNTTIKTIQDKRITFLKEGAGVNPILLFNVTAGDIDYLQVIGNVTLEFDGVNVAYTNGTSTADQFLAAGIFVPDTHATNLNLVFKGSTIALQSTYAIVQQGFKTSSNIISSFYGCTITGTSTAKIMSGAYTNAAYTNVINSTYDCGVSASILAIGTNGWENSNVLASNF